MRKPSQLENEINKRKTFANISHPDAGKSPNYLVHDQLGKPVIIFESDFALKWFKDKNPTIELYD